MLQTVQTIPTQRQALTDPAIFAQLFLKILDKKKRLIPLRYNRAQRDFMSKRTGKDLILKARQLGFSTCIQAELFHQCVTSTQTTLTLAHDDEGTQKLRRMADRFWNYCRYGDMQPARKYDNSTLATYPEFDSESVITKAGSHGAGRGGTYTMVHGSETAFWTDAEKILAGAMQGGNPEIILESTPNGASGLFYELCMEALEGNSIWSLFFFPWWWDNAYRLPLMANEQILYTDDERELVRLHNLSTEQIKWRRSKQLELKRLFPQEYPEDPRTCFLTSGNSFFGDVSDCFTAPMNAEWIEGHEYRAGLDFAQENDFFSMTVIDKTTKQQVDLLHINKLSWTEMRRRVAEKYNYWQLPYLLAEKNSMGGTNIEELQKLGLTVSAFDTTNESKALIMGQLYDALHLYGLKLQPWPVIKHELNTFVATQLSSGIWRLAAAGEGHDDTVISTALANRERWIFTIGDE